MSETLTHQSFMQFPRLLQRLVRQSGITVRREARQAACKEKKSQTTGGDFFFPHSDTYGRNHCRRTMGPTAGC